MTPRLSTPFATLVLLVSASAAAQPPGDTGSGQDASDADVAAEGFELPRDPDAIDPVLAVDVHFSAVVPIASGPLCPPGEECVFGAGGGVGLGLERRWPNGIALGIGYDAWFLDSNNVYELAVMQMLSARLRYYFLPESIVHPWLGVAVGALIFGDTLQIATLGVAGVAEVGLEWELTESIALLLGIPFRFFTTSSFQTRRDRVERAEEPGLNVAAAFQFGLAITETP